MLQSPTFQRWPGVVVSAEKHDSSSDLMRKVRCAVAKLPKEQPFGLDISEARGCSLRLLKVFLNSTYVGRINSLRWSYSGRGDAFSVVPMLAECSSLTSLEVNFEHFSEPSFIGRVFGWHNIKHNIKAIYMPVVARGDADQWFFSVLANRRITEYTSASLGPEVHNGHLCKFLSKNLLKQLDVTLHIMGVQSVMAELRKCTRLRSLAIRGYYQVTLDSSDDFPKSITTLLLQQCYISEKFDWKFLVDSKLRDLELDYIAFDQNIVYKGVYSFCGVPIEDLLYKRGLERFCIKYSRYQVEWVKVFAYQLGRVKHVALDGFIDDALAATLATVLQWPGVYQMESLFVRFDETNAASIKSKLVPALKSPACRLKKLSFGGSEEEGDDLEDAFRFRVAMFALLQGQQVRRLQNPLRRLPVEMFRMVGMML